MKSRRRSVVFWAVSFVFVGILSLLSFPVSWWADYSDNFNRFSRSVKNQDRDEARKDLEVLKEDYNNFTKWKLRYPADRFLFADMYLYEAAVSLLEEDFEKVEKYDLKDKSGWRTSYMLGIAKFWALHSAYQSAMGQKDKKKMALILGIVLDQVRADFEKCVRDGPGPVKNYACSFNYDLTSDPESAEKALANPKPKIKYILQPDGKKPGQGDGKGKKKPGPKPGLNDSKEAGQGGAKKVG